MLKQRLFLMVLIVALLRYLLPFEFFFTSSIYIDSYWSTIYQFLHNDIFTYANHSIDYIFSFYLVWIVGSIFFISKSCISYLRIRRFVRGLKPETSPILTNLVENTNLLYMRSRKFILVRNEQIASPMIFGLVHPYIIIPSTLLSEKEWHYIMQHEMAHYYKGHLRIKFICELLCDLYWWNPCIYLLKKMVYEMIEIDADYAIIKNMAKDIKLEYLDCLLNVSKKTIGSNSEYQWVSSFSRRDTFLLSRRLQCILTGLDVEPSKLVPLKSTLLLLIFCSYLIISFLVVIEPTDEIPKEIADSTFTFQDDGCYFVKNNNGAYDLYINHVYSLTTETLPQDDPNLQVYQSIEEVPFYEAMVN